jgi:DNA-binding XRE family transcriptional regulator
MAPLATDAQRELAVLTDLLTAVRTDHGNLPQHRLASMVGVSTNSVIDWESGQESLTLRHLIAWAHSLALRLVIIDAFGAQIRYPLARDSAEAWDAYELRRLTGALRDVREGSLGLTQLEVARKAGVSRSSIRHWEVLTTPPRSIGFIRWTMALGFRIRLAQLRPPHRILSLAERPGLPTAEPDHQIP